MRNGNVFKWCFCSALALLLVTLIGLPVSGQGPRRE